MFSFESAIKGYSSVGRTSVSKTECRGFKSCCPCFTFNIYSFGGVAQLGEHLPCTQGVKGSNPFVSTYPRRIMIGPVVQLVSTPPCHGGGRGFESLLGRLIWSLSSAGRAPALQAGGHRFEPYSDHVYENNIWRNSSVG